MAIEFARAHGLHVMRNRLRRVMELLQQQPAGVAIFACMTRLVQTKNSQVDSPTGRQLRKVAHASGRGHA
jgi:hypothetical protein